MRCIFLIINIIASSSNTIATHTRILYFLEFFLRVLLILECANMRVQLISQHFRARVCTVLLADLPRTNVKSVLDRANRPDTAASYS